ncbi:Pam16-domain-containing protein [Myxozyma melibiosi]|uniref:Mitochondrial import inner membrane translocase subunit TIM16 n=1 Tax=Myxozyma melibiosi TaxID=54550 RepID=A0ABR1F8P7_9ASCO
MAHRILAQVIVTGAQVFGRAFFQAYKQAAATSATQTANAAREGGLSVEEACRILHVEPQNLQQVEVAKRFEHLFNVNSKEKGGSFYIQSKVYRAKERLDNELAKNSPPPPPGEAGASPTPS